MRQAFLIAISAVCFFAGGAQTGCHPVRARVDIATLNESSPDIVDLIAAVRQMKKADTKTLSNRNLLSWKYQAAIHGTDEVDVKCGKDQIYNNCQHKNDYFLAWHRMYIYSFEKLVQQLSNDPEFRLPYWDWAAGNADGFAKVPALFTKELLQDGSKNPLYLPNRATSIPDQSPYVETAFAFTSFSGGTESFGGAQEKACEGGEAGWFENGAHNNVHTCLGSYMEANYSSARDPIFYLHHSNVDRLWESWSHGYGKNPTDSDWLNQEFSFTFLPARGQPAQRRAGKVSEFLDIRKLGYTYDRLSRPIDLPAAPVGKWVRLAVSEAQTPEPETTAIEIPLMRKEHRSASGAMILAFRKLTWEKNPSVVYRVYLQKGDQPRVEVRGLLSFDSFGSEMAGMHMGDHGHATVKHFLLPKQVHEWFSGNSNAPVHVILVSAPHPCNVGKLNTEAQLTIGSVEVLEGR
jgi:hypothetical protein